MLTKIDIKSAYWNRETTFMFIIGLRSAPKIFNMHAGLTWIAQNAGVSNLIHYLGWLLNYASTICQHNKTVFLCAELGVPLATNKLEGPSNITVIPGYYSRLSLHGDKTAIQQTGLNTAIVKNKKKVTRQTAKQFVS